MQKVVDLLDYWFHFTTFYYCITADYDVLNNALT